MWYNILGFWLVGVALGYTLTFKAGLGLSGIWLGILAGSLVVGTCTHSHLTITEQSPLDAAL